MSLATYLQEVSDLMGDHPFWLRLEITPFGLEMRMSDDAADIHKRLHVQRVFNLMEIDQCEANPLPSAIKLMTGVLRKAGGTERRHRPQSAAE